LRLVERTAMRNEEFAAIRAIAAEGTIRRHI
jgi:hypothetical protein